MRMVYEVLRRWARRWYSREVYLFRCHRCEGITARHQHEVGDDGKLRCVACNDTRQFHSRVYYDHETTRFRELDGSRVSELLSPEVDKQ